MNGSLSPHRTPCSMGAGYGHNGQSSSHYMNMNNMNNNMQCNPWGQSLGGTQSPRVCRFWARGQHCVWGADCYDLHQNIVAYPNTQSPLSSYPNTQMSANQQCFVVNQQMSAADKGAFDEKKEESPRLSATNSGHSAPSAATVNTEILIQCDESTESK